MKDRLLSIKEFIDKSGKVSLKELETAFPGVSGMTIRRDLKRLEEKGDVLIVPGGAVSIDTVLRVKKEEISERISYKSDEKLEIAEKAVKLVESQSCIFIDGGSTTTYFARALPDDHFYILTNAMVIAETILTKEKPSVVLLGGDLKKNTLITVGSTCIDYVQKINIQTAIMTATGFTASTGEFTCGNQSEAEVKRSVIKKADFVIMLLDSSKVNKKSPYTFAGLSDVNCMVVDKNFSKELKNHIESLGIKIY